MLQNIFMYIYFKVRGKTKLKNKYYENIIFQRLYYVDQQK